jgi:hypothetical protein
VLKSTLVVEQNINTWGVTGLQQPGNAYKIGAVSTTRMPIVDRRLHSDANLASQSYSGVWNGGRKDLRRCCSWRAPVVGDQGGIVGFAKSGGSCARSFGGRWCIPCVVGFVLVP